MVGHAVKNFGCRQTPAGQLPQEIFRNATGAANVRGLYAHFIDHFALT